MPDGLTLKLRGNPPVIVEYEDDLRQPELSDAEAIRLGQYVRCYRCGRRFGPSDPAWLPTEEGGVECSLCATGIDFGLGVTDACPSED